MYQQFWVVWRKDYGGTPRGRYATRDAAITEASRLAANSNDMYVVLESVGVVRPAKSPIEFMRNDGSVEVLSVA